MSHAMCRLGQHNYGVTITEKTYMAALPAKSMPEFCSLTLRLFASSRAPLWLKLDVTVIAALRHAIPVKPDE